MFNWFSYSSGALLLGYLVLLVLGIVVTLIVETVIYRKSLRVKREDEIENTTK